MPKMISISEHPRSKLCFPKRVVRLDANAQIESPNFGLGSNAGGKRAVKASVVTVGRMSGLGWCRKCWLAVVDIGQGAGSQIG
jgi:hypothetical protein